MPCYRWHWRKLARLWRLCRAMSFSPQSRTASSAMQARNTHKYTLCHDRNNNAEAVLVSSHPITHHSFPQSTILFANWRGLTINSSSNLLLTDFQLLKPHFLTVFLFFNFCIPNFYFFLQIWTSASSNTEFILGPSTLWKAFSKSTNVTHISKPAFSFCFNRSLRHRIASLVFLPLENSNWLFLIFHLSYTIFLYL